MNNKSIIISIILTLVLLISGTYAYMYFFTEKTDVTMMVDGDKISFNSGESMIVEGIMPVYTMEEGISKNIEIYKENGDYTSGIDLYLKLTKWDTAFASSSFRWSLYKNDIYLSSGDFSSTKEGNEIKLTSYPQKINLYDKRDTYKLYLWIDAYSESSINMMNKSFTVSLYGKTSFYDGNEVVFEESTPNHPELAEGMIPIRYNYIIDEWQKADSTNANNNWYNYDSKMWANAVLVTSTSRDRYMNASVGTTVDEKDIQAYLVWIPRYKYLLFNVNSEEIDPVEIQIVFEKTTDPISNGDENGEYLSHPAFWWDNNSDSIRAEDGSEELAGIWVSKFEMGGTQTEPLIKPNITSLKKQTLNFFYKLNNTFNSTKYFTEKGVGEIDAHIIKNVEWGATAYFSKSRFGINKAVSKNSTYTGRQGNYTYNDFLVSDNIITPTKVPGTGVLASTTGNVYGIYDMGSGALEYTMSFMKGENSSSFCYANSGFNDSNKPESKYYDLYEYNDGHADFSKRILGDATGETRSWHSATTKFINTGKKNCLFFRGYENQFSSSVDHGMVSGGAGNTYGSRSVIVLP